MQNDISSIKQELDLITEIIKETIPVETIYLFGSYAHGIPHKDSDLDAIFAIHKAVARYKHKRQALNSSCVPL